jgi:hypothetical protein
LTELTELRELAELRELRDEENPAFGRTTQSREAPGTIERKSVFQTKVGLICHAAPQSLQTTRFHKNCPILSKSSCYLTLFLCMLGRGHAAESSDHLIFEINVVANVGLEQAHRD